MVWISMFFVLFGLLVIGQGVLMIVWSLWELLMGLFRRDEWRDYPSIHESLRQARHRWRP